MSLPPSGAGRSLSAFGTILVPTDFSEHSRRALETAVRLAGELRVGIHLLHSYRIPVRPVTVYDVTFPAALWDEIHRAAARKLEEWADEARARGIEVETELTLEAPADAILAALRRRPDGLVVMGTHGTGGVRRLVLGSVAERIVREAPCPVVTVRADGASG